MHVTGVVVVPGSVPVPGTVHIHALENAVCYA